MKCFDAIPAETGSTKLLNAESKCCGIFFLGWWWGESILDRNNLNKQALATLLVLK